MKLCPRCEKTFPDTEKFCGDDGTELIPAAGAPTSPIETAPISDADARIECPVCGGKAEPGEIICNFCGARLDQTTAPPAPQSAGMFRTQTMATPPPGPSTGATMRADQDRSFDDEPIGGGEPPSRGTIGIIGYIVAALVALGGGVWLALHLTSHPGIPPVATASPGATASPAVVTGPSVSIASNLLVEVGGAAAATPERDAGAVTKVFDDNRDALLDVYKTALAGDSSLNDGLVAHLSIDPSGKVTSSSVKVSTASNPSLDAVVLNAMVTWNFPASTGESGVDYPIVFASDPTQVSPIGTALSNKIASLNPGEPPEYAFAPGGTPTPAPVAAPLPPPPAVIMPPPVPAPAPPPPRPRRRAHTTPHTPTVTLLQQVQYRLAADPKLRRVQAYTSSGGVVTLYGTVFDDKAKRYAVQVVGAVPGVNSVTDNLTTDTAKWVAEQNRIMMQLQGSGLTGVTVTVIGPNAYLAGTVKSENDKERAVTITQGAAPVNVRGNIIRVQPGSLF